MTAPDPAQASAPPNYSFTLADAMILVAATAPGLALLLYGSRMNFFSMSIMALATGGKLPPGYLLQERLIVSAWCLLPGWTFVVPCLTAIRPKPARREILGGPGFWTCLAASLAVIASLTWFVIHEVIAEGLNFDDLTNREFLFFKFAPFMTNWVLPFSALAILTSLLPLALTGRWRPKPIWTDRFGRAVAASWVFAYGLNEGYPRAFVPLLEWLGIWTEK